MKQITEIGAGAFQTFDLIGEDNERIKMTLRYKPTQQAWYMDLVLEQFELRSLKVVTSPNLLRKFQNVLSFGLSCVTTDGSDPYFLQDFDTGRATINLLTSAEVEQIEEAFFE